jgi:UDP-N-acetylglucosamine--N-acetylmuramyl-(pentapeptide) pyrophosphoryl-undecaprenol N-acetylglucosamine transferase
VRRAVFTGGGTGGHVYPALAVAQALLADPDWRGLYIGTRGRAEERILAGLRDSGQLELPFRSAPAIGYPGPRSPRLPLFLLRLGLGVLKAAGHLLAFRPRVVVATGGYAAAPTVLAAALLRKLRLLKCGILIHEQNASAGLMNRLAGRLADLVALTFPESAEALPGCRTLVTGYPVRAGLESLPGRLEACAALGLDPEKPILFVFGGSQGARALNLALYHVLPDLLERGIQVLHGIGMSAGTAWDAVAGHSRALAELERAVPDWARLAALYHARPYFDQIQLAYAAADLVCCRAGAGALFELLAMGRPALLVPKMGLPGDHQTANARSAERAGAAEVLLEEPLVTGAGIEAGLRPERLRERLLALLEDPARRAELGRGAAGHFHADARLRLAELARGLAEGRPLPAEAGVAQERPARSLERLTTVELAARARRMTDPQDLRYVEYRCLAALCSPAWAERNAGIKLAGQLRLERARPLLTRLAEDPAPAPRLARLLGERRRQNGFIRRNLLGALAQLPPDADTLRVLRAALDDPYWEARVAAIQALADLRVPAEPEVEARMARFRRHGNFEEAQAVARWWAACLPAAGWRQWVLPLSRHANCLVREAAIRALQRRVEAGELSLEEIRGELDGFLLTSTHFRPNFPLKQAMKSLAGQVERPGGSGFRRDDGHVGEGSKC